MPQTETITVVLAGNPNVGKSTLFNYLTGLKQHTGNWPGKTVESAAGEHECTWQGKKYRLIVQDLPGTYSLISNSPEEEIAREYICFEKPDVAVVVVDATCLERNLNLCLQVMELCPKTLLCVNLVDEAKRKQIRIQHEKLSSLLGIPVCLTSSRSGEGISQLVSDVVSMALRTEPVSPVLPSYGPVLEAAIKPVQDALPGKVKEFLPARWTALKVLEGNEGLICGIERRLGFSLDTVLPLREAVDKGRFLLEKSGISKEQIKDKIVSCLVERAEELAKQSVIFKRKDYHHRDRQIDRLVTSKYWGYPIMLCLFGVIFWLTVCAANYPSQVLSFLFQKAEEALHRQFLAWNVPEMATGLLLEGMFRTVGWVVSVMLPPMAIFFPLFTILEDLGYLPRIAFNLDNYFRKACACGKQALTMCMGLGCNAVGITGCRIITSPRERLIAILTNVFTPCNGRFPTLLAIITIYFTADLTGLAGTLAGAGILLIVIVFGVAVTLFTSWALSKTVLRGMPSSFTLELPPYRRPQMGKILVRSFLDRTLFVLGRAVTVAAPAGVVIWLLANVTVGDASLLTHCAVFLDPFARFIGLDGYILVAFLLGFPANEIVIPIVIMCYLSTGQMMDVTDLTLMGQIFSQNGWTIVTAVCTMLFSLVHFPCATTLFTIAKETKSIKWTLLSFFLPLSLGILLCAVTANILRLLC